MRPTKLRKRNSDRQDRPDYVPRPLNAFFGCCCRSRNSRLRGVAGLYWSILKGVKPTAFMLLLYSLTFPTWAQVPDRLTRPIEDYALQANSFIEAFLKISAQFQFPLGIEWVKLDNAPMPVSFSWSRTTVTNVIEAVVSTQAGYDWKAEDGIVHVFERKLVSDSRNPLNITIKEFDKQPETVGFAINDLDQMVTHVVRHPELQGIAGSVLGSPDEPVFRFAAHDVPARSILDKIVTAGLNLPESRMKRIWVVTFPDKPVFSRTGYLEVASMLNPKFVSDETQPFWVLLPWGDPPLENMIK
jgi:hypothetical protein